MSQPEWSSPYSGYLQRAQPYPNPHSYTPEHKLLKLLGLRNAPTEPEGLSLVIFSDRVAIDTKGNIAILAQADYDGLTRLAETVQTLPETGSFRNQWRVRHDITSRPVDRVLYAASSPLSDRPAENYREEFKETSVYGFDKQKVQLQKPVEGYQTLPAALWELTGLVLEARETPGPKDEVVLQRVREILGDVF
ncbi:hypothetical protein BDN70DRAFT_881861 [Pholiota conissans]|uniref:Uncharacterized protein n=1 Tax=Pholiota conissans TaxID=109636 RepID=A0A9P5YWR0_9AGAR|nr:hypothetical protein BDN70DRAFT_881861 [Pholiota conissans]